MLRLVLFAALCGSIEAKARGAVGLDELTFNSIVYRGGNKDVFVKFDKEYPLGDAQEQWKSFAQNIGGLKGSHLLAEVPIQEHGDKLNMALCDRFFPKDCLMSQNKLPLFILFKAGLQDQPVRYIGERTEEGFANFLKQQTGLYIAMPGCLEWGDKAADGFVKSSKKAQDSLLKLAATQVEKVDSANQEELVSAKWYLKVMKRIQEKGTGYVKTETARLNKLKEGKLSDAKKKSFDSRLNILASF